MSELEAVDPSLFARGSDGDPRLGGLVRPGPVTAAAAGEPGATVAILGIADDRGITNGGGRAGAALGPRELRRYLYEMTTGGGGELSSLRLFDLGDATPSPDGARSIEEVHALAEEAVRTALVAGARVVLLGGGHDGACASHSGLMRTLAGNATVSAINVDARCGVGPPRDGGLITNGTPFRRLEERWEDRYSLIEFGIQMQHNAQAHVEWAHAQGWPVLELRRLREVGAERRFQRQLARASTASHALAVSLDLHAVQAASAPGVSDPCSDGFSPAELLAFSRDAGKEKLVRVLDVMERTARLGATAIWSFLAGACEPA